MRISKKLELGDQNETDISKDWSNNTFYWKSKYQWLTSCNYKLISASVSILKRITGWIRNSSLLVRGLNVNIYQFGTSWEPYFYWQDLQDLLQLVVKALSWADGEDWSPESFSESSSNCKTDDK